MLPCRAPYHSGIYDVPGAFGKATAQRINYERQPAGTRDQFYFNTLSSHTCKVTTHRQPRFHPVPPPSADSPKYCHVIKQFHSPGVARHCTRQQGEGLYECPENFFHLSKSSPASPYALSREQHLQRIPQRHSRQIKRSVREVKQQQAPTKCAPPAVAAAVPVSSARPRSFTRNTLANNILTNPWNRALPRSVVDLSVLRDSDFSHDNRMQQRRHLSDFLLQQNRERHSPQYDNLVGQRMMPDYSQLKRKPSPQPARHEVFIAINQPPRNGFGPMSPITTTLSELIYSDSVEIPVSVTSRAAGTHESRKRVKERHEQNSYNVGLVPNLKPLLDQSLSRERQTLEPDGTMNLHEIPPPMLPNEDRLFIGKSQPI
ncbi:hypothetical protein Ciccas_013726 [Cichlidogyrus casuarinus]|uniref:Uncharacterized protein n=1 Tax=Cichlidogyrus casuarinus TaxID=1844966 RepID=A0ABD2PJX9_9PLAT